MDKIELGLTLTGRIERGECFICGKLVSDEIGDYEYHEHDKFGRVKVHIKHNLTQP